MNLRQLAITDLKTQNITDWSLPIELTDPDGIRYNTDAETGEQLKAIQILYDYRKFDLESGGEITVNEPVVSVTLTSLSRVPVAGERWHIRIPLDPFNPDTLSDFVLTEDRAPEGGASLGFIRLYPQKAVQS